MHAGHAPQPGVDGQAVHGDHVVVGRAHGGQLGRSSGLLLSDGQLAGVDGSHAVHHVHAGQVHELTARDRQLHHCGQTANITRENGELLCLCAPAASNYHCVYIIFYLLQYL